MKRKKCKKGEMGVLGIVGVIAIVLVVIIAANQTGLIDLGSVIRGGAGAGDDSGVTSSTPQLNFACADLHSPSTSVTCGAWIKINGGLPKYDADASSIDVSVGDEVEYMINSSGYYRETGKFTMPDKNTQTTDVLLVNYDTAPTIQIYNQDDGLINTASASEALAANCNDAQTVKVLSSYKDGIKGATFVVDFVRTNVDDITFSLGSDIQEPDSLTHNTSAGRGSADTFRSVLIGDMNTNPEITTSENKEFTFTVDCGSSAYGTANMTVGLIDKDYFIDNKGGFSYGYEEPEANTDAGQSHHIFDKLFYTASS